VLARQVGDETVVLDLDNGTYYGLDQVGTRIWQLLAEGKTLAQVCDTMIEEYEVSREEIERDVTRLVADLSDKGLLKPA
jgi:trimethylamine:corrinoid methyltransferase-like protein